ncbi:probable rhamnogalacturonate lyase B isoform X2 [Salvia miltiorrhiza]|uniref:probable rhamnogalacturonate lyase B isoform X2 n=1 Tax=Salvia miltiorrhiza TaxID=226208 RepID=UPI0025AC8132|nr:probable rhamnogalacturonate lyase B isoform X2 [Salvia miltiorrhiza]
MQCAAAYNNISCCFFFFFFFCNKHAKANMATPIVTTKLEDLVVIDNGLVQLSLSNPGGLIRGIQYNGIDNLLELHNQDLNGGFYDLNWSEEGASKTRGKFDTIEGTNFSVIVENEELVEVSFTRSWDPSVEGKQSPLSIDRRFVMLRDHPGFYSYAIFEHTEEYPGFNLNTARIAFMLRKDKFHYMAVADNRQRYMPLPDDRLPGRGQELAYPEAVLLVDPVEPEFKGEVDDKYQYTLENKDNKVHGWICFDPPIGFWQISPSNEFRNGGPFKQDLTSHVNPTTLAIFGTSHYAGEDLLLKFKHGEVWKKVFGPVFIYLNSVPDGHDALSLWNDAKEQMKKEEEAWPYSFTASEDFPKSEQRGRVRGKLFVYDRYINKDKIPAGAAYVGLAPQGDKGSWQRESKGYQFWSTTDEKGYFSVPNIRAGDYNLYAWVPEVIGDYKYEVALTITPGSDIDVGELTFEPPRDGPTLWEIGIPNRSAAEFYVPDPDPMYINKLYVDHPDRFRQYGLWERYTDMYPDKDLVYTVGVSDYRKDWFYAQVTRKIADNIYKATTWQIKFSIDSVVEGGIYKLRLALASAHNSNLQVCVNNADANPPLFSSGVIGGDNAIARHGIHGIYWLFNVDIAAAQLMPGENTIYLTQTKSESPFQGIMYDYIRLEAPSHLDS